MSLNIHLLIIDPQKDFCDPNGSLYVQGAEKDIDRLATFIRRIKNKLSDIHITLDSHRKVDISHPIWWKDSAGNPPPPFTVISVADVESGRWTTRQPGAYSRSLEYLKQLAASGRYPHVIWPEHCLIGSEGHTVMPNLFDAVAEWEDRYALTDYVTKGSNPWTEHFSAVRAEVPDPTDPSTQLNSRLVQTLEDADVVLLAGEASSHCVANTVRDTVAAFSDPSVVSKLVLLTDAMSPVGDLPGSTMFADMESQFYADMRALGMKFDTTDNYLI